jgi:hypothetical protein
MGPSSLFFLSVLPDTDFGFLVMKVNRALFGNNYRRKGEGMSYVMGVEPQLRGVVHIHAVWDQARVPYDLIHKVWNRISGYAWVEPVTSHCGVADYVSKYAVKGGLVSTYVARQLKATGRGMADPIKRRRIPRKERLVSSLKKRRQFTDGGSPRWSLNALNGWND